MNEYDAKTYGERIADVYDDWYPSGDAQALGLVELAHGGRALELGVGTGRVALPLARLGVEVWGIDSSPEMLKRLEEKQSTPPVHARLGDFADAEAEGQFDLIFVVFSTFYGLTSQEDQIRCFRNVANRLTDNGIFVIEGFVPDMTRFARDQSSQVSQIGTDHILMDVSRHDLTQQRITGQHVLITEAGTRLIPIQLRYCWPSEMDLMGRLAGLELQERWGGWDRSAFMSSSKTHISLYRKIHAETEEEL